MKIKRRIVVGWMAMLVASCDFTVDPPTASSTPNTTPSETVHEPTPAATQSSDEPSPATLLRDTGIDTNELERLSPLERFNLIRSHHTKQQIQAILGISPAESVKTTYNWDAFSIAVDATDIGGDGRVVSAYVTDSANTDRLLHKRLTQLEDDRISLATLTMKFGQFQTADYSYRYWYNFKDGSTVLCETQNQRIACGWRQSNNAPNTLSVPNSVLQLLDTD